MTRRRMVAAIVLAFLVSAAAASAAVTSEFFLGTLTASSDGADAIAVTCAAGTVKVNGADPDTGPELCAEVDSVAVSGGPGANTLDLDALGQGAFPRLASVAALGDAGDDTVAGSPLSDEVDGGEENDVIRGNAGEDALDGGEGSDRVFGGAGDDMLFAGFGSDALDGQQGSDTYELDLAELGNARVADSGTEGLDVITIPDCNDVRVEPTRISKGDARVAVSGIERFPCHYVLPPEYRPDACVVPRVRGKVLARARVLLAKAHCGVGKVRRARSTTRKGVVLAQAPVAGKRLPKGGKVALTVSRGRRR
jgi:Ca2+-binding RTX toxin-like protein